MRAAEFAREQEDVQPMAIAKRIGGDQRVLAFVPGDDGCFGDGGADHVAGNLPIAQGLREPTGVGAVAIIHAGVGGPVIAG